MKTVSENVMSVAFSNATAQKRESLWDETELPVNLSYIGAGNARGIAFFRLHCSLRTHSHTLKVFSEQQPDIEKNSFRQDNVKTWGDFAVRSLELQIVIEMCLHSMIQLT